MARGETSRARPTPGFNLFSVEQDVEIGRQSAVEAERQLPLLRNGNVDRYLNKIISKLAAQAPGARYPYAIKAVNATDINAFSLPGGPMYVNRGLFEAARSEAELAGVLAHEMSHVALRHATHQASKAYLGQAGLGILGGLLGKNGNNTAQIVNAVGGLGLNAVFLKFSRDAEYQADQLGAEIMAGAGYNPVAMASLFELLRSEQGRDPGKLERFFSSHPPPADREARIRDQAGSLRFAGSRDVGGFDRMRADLRRLAPASPQRAAQLSESHATRTAAARTAVNTTCGWTSRPRGSRGSSSATAISPSSTLTTGGPTRPTPDTPFPWRPTGASSTRVTANRPCSTG